MGHYKIKNMTALLPKRDANKNKMVVFDYSSGFETKTCEIPVGGEVFIECNNLPISVHKLRINKHVSVNEISKNNFLKKQAVKPKINDVVSKPTPVFKEKKVDAVLDIEHEYRKKRSYSKKSSDLDNETL
jgi:hypothetical protein